MGLWLAIEFEIKLHGEVINKISTIDDNCVALLALDTQDKGFLRRNLHTTLWQSFVNQDEIYNSNWLLCYEAAKKGWLSINDGSNYSNTHQCFGDLSSNNISFYDETSYNDTTAILEKLKINSELYST